ncbi:MAG TPA: protein-disulfide reductase DsbD N-terminal domain-containing protein [Pyrinomonadaceae bacterium]|nr:protein-disulfide reductase DsbD N-terminal domain-containing protein [Pyrinomonadaceae bacterium]
MRKTAHVDGGAQSFPRPGTALRKAQTKKMIHRTLILLLCCLAVLALDACSAAETPAPGAPAVSSSPPATSTKTLPAEIVRASASEVLIAAGGTAEASVQAQIADGYHINANPPTLSYLIATQLLVEAGGGITAGRPVYPSPITKQFAFEKQPLAVYEGEASIKLPLRAEATASKGLRTLAAKLRVQACDDQACYPPRTIELSIPVNVK